MNRLKYGGLNSTSWVTDWTYSSVTDDLRYKEQQRIQEQANDLKHIARLLVLIESDEVLQRMGVCEKHFAAIRSHLSNLWPFEKPMIYQGVKFFSTANFVVACMLEKADIKGRRKIAAMNPVVVLRYGRDWIQGKGLMRPDYSEDMHEKTLELALRHKFAKDTNLHKDLLSADDAELGRPGDALTAKVLAKLRAEWMEKTAK